MFLLLHWWNNIVCQKKFHPTPAPPDSFVNILISIIEKKLNGKYVEFDFRIGTVLAIFLFFWMDSAPLSAPVCKFFRSIMEEKN